MGTQNGAEHSEQKDTLVAGLTSLGVEVRGTLVKLSRFAVVFEIYSPGSILNLSEVLSDFRVVVNDRTIYSGHATVRNLMNSGQVVICEVTLEEDSWRDVDFDPAARNGALGEKFNEFLQEWQKVYKVLPEYKMIIADIQVFLTDLRLWLEQMELGIRAMPAGDRAKAERELVGSLVQPIGSALNHLFEKFEFVAGGIAPELQPVHSLYVKRQLHPLLLCSPFMHRIYRKPLGYAGDYEMVNMILRDPHEGSSTFSKILNRWFLSQTPAEAHRNRIRLLTERIAAESLRVTGRKDRLRIFNLGCGPAKEVVDFMEHYELSDRTEFTLLDFNEEAMAYTGSVLSEARRRFHRATSIQLVKKSVVQMLKAAGRNTEAQYDFIYCAGLLDYLQDRVSRPLMNMMYGMLAPGGLLLATNVDAGNPIRRIMDFIFEWHLLYRTHDQMVALIPDRVSSDDYKVTTDGTGCNIFVEIRKPEVQP